MTAVLDSIFAEAQAEPWPLPTDHLSATQLSMFARCPEQYRKRYVLGHRDRPGAALVWGAADHYAHEQNFRQKITSGEDISLEDVKLACAEGFDQAVERNGGEKEIAWDDDKPGELKDAAVKLAALYHVNVSPGVQPVAVEEWFSLDIPGVAVPVVGAIDVEQEASRPDIERKTSKRSMKEPKPDWQIQGRLYQAVKQKAIAWHVSVKSKAGDVLTPATGTTGLYLPMNERRVEAIVSLTQSLVGQMLDLHARYGPNEPWPGNITHSWACQYCGFRPNCRWWEQ